MMSGRRGGPRGGPRGDRGRGRGGRGGGRGDFRAASADEGLEAVKAIAQNFAEASPRISPDFDSPETPEYGPARVGEPADYAVNYFELQCRLENAYQYSIFIGCEYNQGLERLLMDKLAQQENWPNGWIFDGRNTLYTSEQFLPSEERELNVELEQGGRSRAFKVKIAHTTVVPLSGLARFMQRQANIYPAEAVRVLEILLGHAASMLPHSLLHRKSVFFNRPDRRHDIQNGAEAWMGYHQSIRPCQNGLFLNIDASCAPFYKPIQGTEFIKEILGLRSIPRDLSPQQISIVKSIMKNLMVTLVRGGSKKKVVGLKGPPAECTFDHREQGKISVLDYYNSIGHRLQFPGLPCLDCTKPRKPPCYLPLECVTIAHGQFVRKITERHQEQMIRQSAQRPEEKERYLNDLIRGDANINQMQKTGDFQISSASPDMKRVRGRILPPPFLTYKEPKCFFVGTDGQWNLGGSTMKFYKGKKLKSWAVMSLAEKEMIDVGGENGIGAFIGELASALRAYEVIRDGSNLSTPPLVYAGPTDLVRSIDECKRTANESYGRDPDLILCVLPRRSDPSVRMDSNENPRVYKAIKKASDVDFGIPTQCFAADKAGVGGNRPPRGRAQYCANLALKINVKVGFEPLYRISIVLQVGGTNSVLLKTPCSLPVLHQSKPYMILGADVSHAAPGSQLPSIAAVVGSVDPMASRYSSRVTTQGSREEIITDMKASVEGLLGDFYEHNGVKPESIIMFRDGVSEGFFSKVITAEYKAIREACRAKGDPSADYTPPITYIVIQKRHHTRLFPRGQNATHRSGNVKPGTVVDSDIVSPFGHDFFLCAQAGIQGTVRAAHYHVLVDENRFGSDALQMMCYWMCYMQCRCTKPISVPAPANYAHLAALRARLIAGEETDDDVSSIASGGAGPSGATGPNFAASQNKMYYV